MDLVSGGAVANSLATVSFYGAQSNCGTKFCRFFKKKIMKNVKAIVLPDVFKTRLFERGIFSLDEKMKLLDLERIHSMAFNKEILSSIKKLKVNDPDTYIALAVKSLRELLMRYRLNNKMRSQLIIFVSSTKLAKQLGVKKKNTYTFSPCTELMNSELEQIDLRLKNYTSDTNKKNQRNNKDVRVFTSFEDLCNQIQSLLGDRICIRNAEVIVPVVIPDVEEEESKEDDDSRTIQTLR
jgi:hypothetical protein